MDCAKPLPSYLIERYKGWHATRFAENRAWYSRLSKEGQRPRAMVLGCCDSRVDAAALFGAEPGELFMLRNVANLAPPYRPDHEHHGTSAAIEYAVVALQVTNIVVLGHAQCGGVEAYLRKRESNGNGDDLVGEFIGPWIDVLEPAYERLIKTDETEDRQRRFEQAGVVLSLENLMTFPFVKQAVEAGRLDLHGAWFDISAGALHIYDPQTGDFALAG